MNDDSSESRNTSGPAMSVGRPHRPSTTSSPMGGRVAAGEQPRGQDHVGRDAVDANAVRPPLARHRPGQRHQPRFGGTVRGVSGGAVEAAHRCDERERAARTVVDHVPGRRPTHIQVVREVHADVVFPRVEVDGEHVLDERRDPDDVGDPVEAAELRVRVVDHLPCAVGRGDVADDRNAVHLVGDTARRGRDRCRRPPPGLPPRPAAATSRARSRSRRPPPGRPCRPTRTARPMSSLPSSVRGSAHGRSSSVLSCRPPRRSGRGADSSNPPSRASSRPC